MFVKIFVNTVYYTYVYIGTKNYNTYTYPQIKCIFICDLDF